MKNRESNSPRISKITVLVCTLSLALIPLCFAQDNDEEEEKKHDHALKRSVELALFKKINISSQVNTLINKKFSFSLFDIKLSERFYARALEIRPTGLGKIPTLKASFYIMDVYQTSPALENIVLPRHSLNVDPFTGKFYWEW